MVVLVGLGACATAPAAKPVQPQPATPSAPVQEKAKPGDADAVLAKVKRLEQRGEYAAAEALMTGALERDSGLARVRVMLGRFMAADGREPAQLELLQAGLKQPEAGARAAVLIELSHVHEERWRRGPNIHYGRGTVTAKPADPDMDEDAWKARELKAARDHAERALTAAPELERAQLRAARMRLAQQAYADAEPLFRKLVASQPREVGYLYYHARSLAPLGRQREAIAALERAVELDPHLRPAWQGLVALYEGEGMKGAAEQASARVRFLGFVPPFLQAPYSPQAAATAARLSGHHEGEVDVMKELRALAADPSESSTKLLAAYVLRHPHDASETLAFDALRARAKSIGGDMLLLAENAGSKCISRQAYSILAESGHPRAFDALIARLPFDLTPLHHDDIAGALASLGDARAVPALVEQLGRPDSEQTDSFMSHGVVEARQRATLALGHFDVPQARAALEKVRAREDLAPFAAVALYRLSRDRAHLQGLIAALAGRGYDALHVIGALSDLTEPEAIEARRLLEEQSDREDEE